MADRAELEKLNKGPLLDYTMQVLAQYEQLVENYNILANNVNELQKQNEDLNTKLAFATQATDIAAPMEVGQVMEHPEYIHMFKKAEALETKVEALTNEYTQLEVTLKETNNELNEALQVIENLKIEKNKKIETIDNINSLPKTTSDKIYSVNTYNVRAYENRVDNSKTYGGREFNIATIITKVDGHLLTWQIDFNGSTLYPNKVYNRCKIFSDDEIGMLMRMVGQLGWYTTIKNYLGIPDEFNPDEFYKTGLFFGTEDTSRNKK